MPRMQRKLWLLSSTRNAYITFGFHVNLYRSQRRDADNDGGAANDINSAAMRLTRCRLHSFCFPFLNLKLNVDQSNTC